MSTYYTEINAKTNDRIQEIAIKLAKDEHNELEKNELAVLVYPKLKYFIWKNFCKNDHDAEEALQWTLKRVFKNVRQFDVEKGRFTTWIYTIARNETLYYLHQMKKTNHQDVEPIMNIIDYDDDSDQSIARKNAIEEIYQKTMEAIMNIKDDTLKGIAISKMIERKKVKDIATKYALNENTVKTKLRKIRTDLAEAVIDGNPYIKEKIDMIV